MHTQTARPMSLARCGALAVSAALAFLLVAPASAAASLTLGIANASFEFNVAPGQKGAGETYIYNDGNEPMKVMVYAVDQVVDDKGEISYVPPARDPGQMFNSPGSWIRITLPTETQAIGNTPYLEMEPGDRVPVKFDFEVPQGVAPGDHQVLIFFEIFSFPGEVKGTGSTVSGRIGARIRMRVKGEIRQELAVRPFELKGFVIGGKAPYSLILRNEGNVDIPLKANLTLLNGSDAEVLESVVVTGTTVYADTMSEHAGAIDVSGVAPGLYTAELRVDYKKESAGGGTSDDKIVVRRSVWIVPLWLVALVIVVVGGLAIWLSWRAAARSKLRRSPAPEAE